MRPEFTGIVFQDPSKAESNVERLAARLPQELVVPAASLLAHSPDPDGALNLLERYVQGAPADVLEDLKRYPTALTYLVAIFGYSTFLAESFFADPSLPLQFARDRKFTKLKSREELMQDYARFATTHPDVWLSAQLARFKRRNYLRIVLKDVLGLSTLGETTLELSMLADVMLWNALIFCDQELEKRYGQPQYRDAQGRIVRSGFSIVSLGKLGGNELNYSSDIDLLFLYEKDGETAGGSEADSIISNKEYFVRLAHAITRTITQSTPQGQVFRVDLRLRPEGEMGDLAISLKSALEYYARRAREWELQMLIKARHSVGQTRVTREFLRGVEPHIYGSPADFAAVEAVLKSRERITRKLEHSRSNATDVKLHRGGIRDIEFLTQCLQRLHGGEDRWVRSGGTLLALRKLNDKGWISDRDYAALVSAYEFLRNVEHRVQFELGLQTHRLPTEPDALDRLGLRTGIESRKSPGEKLVRKIQSAFNSVTEIHKRIVRSDTEAVPGTVYALKPLISPVGDHAPHSYKSLLEYLDSQAPELSELVKNAKLPERTRKSVARLFGALLAHPEGFSYARQQPACVERALEIGASSDYLTGLLVHHPEDISALDHQKAVPPAARDQEEMNIGLERRGIMEPFAWVSEGTFDVREKMALLRRNFRSTVLELGSADLRSLDDIYPCLEHWTELAGRSVASALWIGHQAQDGAAQARSAGMRELPFVILGLGRLGLSEFDLASDADLMFVAPADTPREEIAQWMRLAEKAIEVLSSYTRDGTLFVVDTRLRPRGQEGELVPTHTSLLGYVRESAQVWEALTYLKACPLAGNEELARGLAGDLVTAVMDRFQNYPDLEGELQMMRHRLEREKHVPPDNTKTAPGGYYDVDFAVSYLRLRHRVLTPFGANMATQIDALRSAGALSDADADSLRHGAAFLRSVDHAVRLVTGKAAEGLPAHVGHREAIENLARHWGLVPPSSTLAEKLKEAQQEVRYIYRRMIGSD
jgi:[glutamine synthetase] adenylyltransferase / [glutamine synthetase]-adenylyl-L-tyrosine phosphorylase